MHSISDLREYLESKEIKIKESCGWYLIVGKDKYTMLDDEFYINREKFTKKELLAKINGTKVRKKKK